MHLHDQIISLRRKGLGQYNYFTPITFHCSTCTKSGKWAVMYLCLMGINLAYFYDLSIRFWKCADSVVFFFNFILHYRIEWYFLVCHLVTIFLQHMAKVKMRNGRITALQNMCSIVDLLSSNWEIPHQNRSMKRKMRIDVHF
jgi:hypothetical protein